MKRTPQVGDKVLCPGWEGVVFAIAPGRVCIRKPNYLGKMQNVWYRWPQLPGSNWIIEPPDDKPEPEHISWQQRAIDEFIAEDAERQVGES